MPEISRFYGINLSKIEFSENGKILCFFANGELRLFNVREKIKDRYIDKIISDNEIFKSAKIGKLGEIYWADMGEIKDLQGNVISCEYDVSPEFIYNNSKVVKKLKAKG